MLRPHRLMGALTVLLFAGAGAACHSGASTTSTTTATAAPETVQADGLLYGDAAFKKKLRDALAAKGASYVPRTKHKDASGPKYVNRLIHESSPYLQQHAHNPVNWFPWGDEAFAVAHKLGRPVFLSVGYSTCHWCHVMEEESFEDEEIAKYINDHYVPIKVDREERPDVDAVYMRGVQLLTGRGGWPMSVWLTPDKKPYFGGTYFPPRDGVRGARRGFLTILRELRKAYDDDPAGVVADAEQLAKRIQSNMAPPTGSTLPTNATVLSSSATASKRYDADNGGPKGRPKFPSSFPTRLLLRHGHRTSGGLATAESTKMAIHTLAKMHGGGMYDHVGGGFHRYSVDDRWLVPHFEKMLYDNALLSLAYIEGWQVSKVANLKAVATEVLEYVVREMTDAGGGYYSATDADSLTPKGHREEGYYFTWTIDEVNAALPEDVAASVRELYVMTPRGNFEGRNILNMPSPPGVAADKLGIELAVLEGHIEQAKPILRNKRDERPKPLLDDKIQVSWNGLMIAAMARGGRVLGEPRFTASAKGAADYLLANMRKGGRMHHSIKSGQLGEHAFAEDFAFFAVGLLEVFQSTADVKYLSAAIELMEQLEKHHARKGGGYFRSAADAETLLAREVETRDGAVPSAASWALMAHLQLNALTTDDKWRQRAEATMKSYGTTLAQRPWSLDEMMIAVDWYTDRAKEVAIVVAADSQPNDEGLVALKKALHGRFVPNHVLVIAKEGDPSLSKHVPWIASKPTKKGAATAYVCESGACELPTTDPKVFAKQLSDIASYEP
jgi:uncharacterized protein